MQKPYLEAGKIVNTHGVRGEVRIQPWADDAAFLLGFRTFYIDGAPVPVAHSRVHKGMRFGGVCLRADEKEPLLSCSVAGNYRGIRL